MTFQLNSLDDLARAGVDTLIDVRAPLEFAEDHLPGAINLPVLNDAERARIGTIYKQESPFRARKLGAALVARNAAAHLEGALAEMPGGWRPLVYCWRGGQRSGAFASILRQIGWRVEIIDGGYKRYRALVQAMLYEAAFPAPVLLLDGGTGTAKTEILARVAARGGQVIDLEALAAHRGSLFGAEGSQPAQKLFESRLAQRVRALDPGRPVLIEAESSRIGRVRLPPALWRAMGRAAHVQIAAPLDARVAHVRRGYAGFIADPDRLHATLDALRPLHARAQVDAWQEMLAAGDFDALVRGLITTHYDPRYARARAASPPVRRIVLPGLSEADQEDAATTLLTVMRDLEGAAARVTAR